MNSASDGHQAKGMDCVGQTEARDFVMTLAGLDALIALLQARGYTTLGPRIRDGAIVYAEIDSHADLPIGWQDLQGPGSYRLEPRQDRACFGYAVGPHSWKRFLLPPRQLLFRAQYQQNLLQIEVPPASKQRLALFGVRGCELAAIQIQDRVLREGPYADPDYQARRDQALIIAVNCHSPAQTCFCSSAGTGPEVGEGYDLALSELTGESLLAESLFVVRAGSPAGAELLAALPPDLLKPATAEQLVAEAQSLAKARSRIGPGPDPAAARQLINDALDGPIWESIAERCLACANCTLSCPTCFCTSVSESSDGDGGSERWREWDSCFSLDFSYLHGGAVRQSRGARYRQWLSHKLASWYAQFGSSGCVGCGRCISWCPVGIDLRQEVHRLSETVKGMTDEGS
ncbi:MAG: 4Fe-4S dicluster domain-containing protein [Candidatus Sericytochromatia bacterium]